MITYDYNDFFTNIFTIIKKHYFQKKKKKEFIFAKGFE